MWADEIKQERPETFTWHFVDIPWDASGFNEQRDCQRPRQSTNDHANCVVDRIEFFKRVLSDRNASQVARVEALKFLVHLVADIHQPLHAIARDHGGTRTAVVQFGRALCGTRACNLHLTWDIGLIEHQHLAQRAYVQRIEKLVQDEKLEEMPIGNSEEWANDSFRLAHQVWVEENGMVDERYYERNINIVDHQLALAGLRLAAMLNEALAH
jgi:S1/P1 Nuclease